MLREGDVFRFPDAGDAMERLAAEGAEPFYGGEIGTAVTEWVRERGGTLGPGRHGGVRADRARAGPRELPGGRGADQPAARPRAAS